MESGFSDERTRSQTTAQMPTILTNSVLVEKLRAPADRTTAARERFPRAVDALGRQYRR